MLYCIFLTLIRSCRNVLLWDWMAANVLISLRSFSVKNSQLNEVSPLCFIIVFHYYEYLQRFTESSLCSIDTADSEIKAKI